MDIRRLAAQGWTIESGTTATRSSATGQFHVVSTDKDGWNLEVFFKQEQRSFSNILFYWNSDDLGELLSVNREIEEVFVRRAVAETLPPIKEVRDLGNGISARLKRDGLGFEVRLSREGDGIGQYWGTWNKPLTAWILGEDTIQGARSLKPEYHGPAFRLGNAMIDLAEEVSGLRAVPHGHMYSPGEASDMAMNSWAKRSARQGVPGMEGDAAIEDRFLRASIVKQVETRRYTGDRFAHGYNTALETGRDLFVVLDRPRVDWQGVSVSCEDTVMFAWALDGNARPVTVCGYDDHETVLRHNLFLAGYYHDEVDEYLDQHPFVTVPHGEIVEWAVGRFGDKMSVETSRDDAVVDAIIARFPAASALAMAC
jgi:hypothetical protein